SPARPWPTSRCTTSPPSARSPSRPSAPSRPEAESTRQPPRQGKAGTGKGASPSPFRFRSTRHEARMSEIEALTRSALAEVEAAASLEALESLRVSLLGKHGQITGQLKQLGKLPPEQRKGAGEAVNRARDALTGAIAARRQVLEEAALAARLASERIDVSLPGRGPGLGNLHPLRRTLERITDIFAPLGYPLAEGAGIEDD